DRTCNGHAVQTVTFFEEPAKERPQRGHPVAAGRGRLAKHRRTHAVIPGGGPDVPVWLQPPVTEEGHSAAHAGGVPDRRSLGGGWSPDRVSQRLDPGRAWRHSRQQRLHIVTRL